MQEDDVHYAWLIPATTMQSGDLHRHQIWTGVLTLFTVAAVTTVINGSAPVGRVLAATMRRPEITDCGVFGSLNR